MPSRHSRRQLRTDRPVVGRALSDGGSLRLLRRRRHFSEKTGARSCVQAAALAGGLLPADLPSISTACAAVTSPSCCRPNMPGSSGAPKNGHSRGRRTGRTGRPLGAEPQARASGPGVTVCIGGPSTWLRDEPSRPAKVIARHHRLRRRGGMRFRWLARCLRLPRMYPLVPIRAVGRGRGRLYAVAFAVAGLFGGGICAGSGPAASTPIPDPFNIFTGLPLRSTGSERRAHADLPFGRSTRSGQASSGSASGGLPSKEKDEVGPAQPEGGRRAISAAEGLVNSRRRARSVRAVIFAHSAGR